MRRITATNQEYLDRKQKLELENRELEREKKLRQDLIQLRLGKVSSVIQKQGQRKLKEKQQIKDRQRQVVDAVLQDRGLEAFEAPMSPRLKEKLSKLEKITSQQSLQGYRNIKCENI